MSEIDVEPTAQAIIDAADYLRSIESKLRHTADRMRETKDITYASEAANAIANILPNMRIDLLVTRPIRALSARERKGGE
jgi:hypothetical protein